jgi:hypothetical protein
MKARKNRKNAVKIGNFTQICSKFRGVDDLITAVCMLSMRCLVKNGTVTIQSRNVLFCVAFELFILLANLSHAVCYFYVANLG